MTVEITNHGEVLFVATPKMNMIDNYIYVHHTNTLIVLPTFPESISDKMSTSYSSTTILGRSAPIYSYSNSGPRTIDVQLHLHRDMMNDINTSAHTDKNTNLGMALFSSSQSLTKKIQRKDYIDILINELQSIALPNYAVSQKMVNPPLVTVRFGDEVFCKGVVDGGVSVTFNGPILDNPVYDLNGEEQFITDERTGKSFRLTGKGKYALADISFTVHEVDPYDAETVAAQGSFRGINRTLERNLYVGGK